MPIRTTIQPFVFWRNAIFAILCVVFGLWGWYDYSIKIPNLEADCVALDTAKEQVKKFETQSVTADLNENEKTQWNAAKKVVEEITRRFGTSNLGRTARQDTELAGARIAAGDQIIGIYPLAGLDERVNPDPMTFDPRRKGRKHLNFGSGPHTCLGARLARREIRIFIEEWVAKMPVCRIAPGTQPRMSSGLINSMRDLCLEWDPA